jgi:hypothetical protein
MPGIGATGALAVVTLVVPLQAFAQQSVSCGNISAPPAAIYLTGESLNTTFNGNNFGINGNDFDYTNGLPGPMPAIWGIAARNQTDADEIRNSLNTQQRNNVQGRGYVFGSPSTPSVGVETDPSPAQLDQFVSDLLAWPHMTINASIINGNQTFGTQATPQITYLNNSSGVTFGNGNTTGYGVMIVEHSLTLNGNIDFKGLMLVRGPLSITQVTSSATVWGSIWTTDFNLTIGGHADIQYSSQALQLASLAGASGACEPVPTPTGPTPIATPTLNPMRTITTTRTPTPTPSPTSTETVTTPASPGPTGTPTEESTSTRTPIESTPSPMPSPTVFACAEIPEPGCRQPASSSGSAIVMKDRVPDTHDVLRWRWSRGEATMHAEFGDPNTVTSYILCVYDEVNGSPDLVIASGIPAGGTCGTKPCWKTTKRGFKYADKDASRGGVTAMTLKEGLEGAAQTTLKGRGSDLSLPPLPLSQDSKVTVQLRNDLGTCWEAVFTAPAIRNEQIEFRDKSD